MGPECYCDRAAAESAKNPLKPYTFIFEPFNRMVISIRISRNRPRGWYSFNVRDGNKYTRLFTLERINYQKFKCLSAYSLTIWALSITIGW